MPQAYYDYINEKLINSSGTPITNDFDKPVIPYQNLVRLEIKVRELNETTGDLDGVDLSAYPSWELAIDKDYVSTTNIMAEAENADIDSSDSGNGNFIAIINTDTTTFLAEVQGSRDTTVYCDLIGRDASGYARVFINFEVIARNLINPNSGDPGDPPSNYPTKAEVAAAYVAKVIDTQISIANTDTENINLGSKTSYRAFEIEGYSEVSTSRNYFKFRIEHNDSTATLVPLLNDNPITNLGYTADISSDTARFNITNNTGSIAKTIYATTRSYGVTS